MEALKKNPDDEETEFFWLMTLDWYAHMLVENSREKEGYKYLLEAYDLSKKINGLEHEQTITILNDLGTINCRQGEYDLSIKFLNQAIEAGKKTRYLNNIVLESNTNNIHKYNLRIKIATEEY